MRKKLKNQNAVRSKYGPSNEVITIRVTEIERRAYKIAAYPYSLSKWARTALNKESKVNK